VRYKRGGEGSTPRHLTVVHALDVVTDRVACGRPVVGLQVFELDWDDTLPEKRCPACAAWTEREMTGTG
jgi:hypothetical protein